jgi:GAF domain-containing protein
VSESETETTLAQSLQVQGESIGELLLGSIKQNKDEAAEIVAAVAERLSAHLENLRLAQQTQNALNETQRRTEELAVLNEMSQALTAQTTVDGVFQTVYDFLSRLMDTTDFYTVIYDEENDEVEFVLTASGKELCWHTERRQAGHGVTEYLIRQRQPLLMSSNVGQRLVALGIEGYGNLPESWLGVPIILGDRVLGMIGVESYTTPNLYNEQHLNLLTAIANQAAIAVESTRLLEGTVALAEEEQILRQITTRVSTAVDAESILRTAAEEIGRALGLEGYVSLEAAGSNGTNGHGLATKSKD